MTYQPPANINDFARHPATEQALRQQWHQYIKRAISGLDRNLFYDADADPAPGVPPARAPIPWNGFPRSIWEWYGADADPNGPARAFATAETAAPLEFLRPDLVFTRHSNGQRVPLQARQQDEYCEWFADRDVKGGITRISFTCEGPEYWERMWDVDSSLVIELYQEHLRPGVSKDQLRADLSWAEDIMDSDGKLAFKKDSYNRWNKWTTTHGAMHLTHPANTLGAEIRLAADATRVFPTVTPNPPNTLPARLICCAGYGGVNRSSDPLIGAGVNNFARQGLCVTLDNPVGLYMRDLAMGGLQSPTGQPIGPQCLHIKRASPDGSLILRAEITPPPGANYSLDQCTFEGHALTGGGPMARRITMVLFGLAKTITGRTAEVVNACSTKCCKKPASNYLAGARPTTNCANIDWSQEGPFEPGVAPQTPVIGVGAEKPSTEEIQRSLAGSRGRF